MNNRPGVRAHDFGKLPLQELASAIGAKGFRTVQLALAKAIADVDSSTGKLSPGLANHIAEAFDRRGIRIAVLGCYINPVHPDPDQRRQEIRRFKEHLRYARDFGTSVVATETGRLDTYRSEDPVRYKEKAWSILRETVSELAEEAEKWGITLGLEPAVGLTLHSSDQMVQLMEEVPSTSIGVVFDACNLLDRHNMERQDEVLEKAFAQLANRTVLFHAKDIVLDDEGKHVYQALGKGLLNYPLYLNKIKELKPYADILMEGVPPSLMDESLAFYEQTWGKKF